MGNALDTAKRRLRLFAEKEAAGVSPLYAHLAAKAAEDDDVAGLLTAAREGEGRGTLFMAVAHRLVQADPIHPLSRYYPSAGGFDGVDDQTWPLFREFLLDRAERARELISTRYTQTNEVRRASLVYPAIGLAAKAAGGKIALLEAGCSAGLLLGLDRFSYRYQCDGGEQLAAGPAKAAVGLHCALDLAPGVAPPKPPKKLNVVARIGLDRAPVDLTDEEQLAWLEACVWADQLDRIRLLRAAAAEQRGHPAELVTGDMVDDLAATAARLPSDVPLVVLTSHALAYVPREGRERFVALLGELARDRPLWWVTEEGYEVSLEPLVPGRDELRFTAENKGMCVLGLVHWEDGGPVPRVLARTAPHGQRMTWLGG